MFEGSIVDICDSLNLTANETVLVFSEGDFGTVDMTEEEAGELVIEEEDIDAAYEILSAYVREKENNTEIEPAIPVHEIGQVLTTEEDTNDALAFLCEAQPFIQEARKNALIIKERLNLAKNNYDKRLPYEEYNRLCIKQDDYWRIFNRGVAACKAAVGSEKVAWIHYFEMDEEERHSYLQAYLNIDIDPYFVRNENEQEDMRKARQAIYGIKTEDINEDSRRQRTNLQLADAHIAEQSWNGKWIHDCLDGLVEGYKVDFPVRNGGFIPYCRDVTHEYVAPNNNMCDEEFASLVDFLF